MPSLQRISTPELRGLYSNSNRFTQPKGTVPRISNLYMIRRGAFHTVPGSKWISSWDGLAPHVTNQLPIVSINWYSPSVGSAPDVYMTGQPMVNAHNFVLSMQVAASTMANLLDVSTGTFATLGGPIPATPPLNATQFSDVFVTALGQNIPPRVFPVVALLTANIGTTDTTIGVLSTLGWPNSGFFQVGTEAIQYTSKTATGLAGCTRAALGTVAASHLANALATFGINNSGAFLADVWHRLGNQFIATNVYPPWPGIPNGSASVAVNINTVIVAFDGNNTYWPFKAQNSGFTGNGTGYWGPQFWPGGVNGGGTMTSGSPTLTAVGNTPFTAAMVGLPCTVVGAGAGGGPLITMVLTFTSSSVVQLANNAAANVTAVGFSIGTGNFGDVAPDHNGANNTGTEVWINVGQASLPPPGAAFVFQHESFLFLWGVGSTYGTDGITGPDALWQSNFQTPNSFDPANTTFVGKGNGTAQGGAVYSLSEAGIAATPQLVLFKDFKTYSFLNVFPNASLVEASGGLGCIAPYTIQFIGGFGVMRLTYAGFSLFDGQLEHITEYTDSIQGYLFGGLDGVTGIDFTQIKNAVSCQCTNPPMYVALLPLPGQGGYNTRGFAYDFALKQWTIIDFPFVISAAAFLPQAAVALAQKYTTLVAGSQDGTVRRLFAADPTWDGTTITWSMQMPDFGSPGTPIYARRLNARITNDSVAGGPKPAFTVVSFSGVRRSGTVFTRGLNVPNSILGSMDIGEVVLSGAVSVTGTGQVLIEGSDLQVSEKPMTRIGL